MNIFEKEVRRIANEVVDEKKKLFAKNRWNIWEKIEDEELATTFEQFIVDQACKHGRTANAIRERIKRFL